MGMLLKGESLNEDTLTNYMRSFDAPLTQQAITVLSSLFKLDCHLTAQVDDALANHGRRTHLGRTATPLAEANPNVSAAGLAAT